MEPLGVVVELLELARALHGKYARLDNSPRIIAELMTEVAALAELLSSISKLEIHGDMKNLMDNYGFRNLMLSCGRTLDEIYQEIQDIVGDGTQRGGLRSGLVRYRTLRHHDRLKHLQNDLDRYKASLSVLFSGLSIVSNKVTTGGIESLQERISQLEGLTVRQLVAYEELVKIADERQLRAQILDWISTYDYQAAYHRIARGSVKGTGLWLLSKTDYIQWKGTPQNSLIFTGQAGCGKSTLCSIVIGTLQKENTLGLAYFFVNAAEKLSFEKILRSLLRQLLEQLTDIPVQIHTAFKSRRSLTSGGELIDSFYEVVSGFDEATVVIDGLNELELDDRVDMLKFLSKAQRINLKWIAFSRPCPGLVVSGVLATECDISHQNDSDLRLFVSSRLKKNSHLANNPKILKSLAETVVHKASGNFLWSKLVLDLIFRQNSFKHMRFVMEQLPNELANYYELMWRELDEATKVAVSLVALSPRPLAMSQLETLVNEIVLDTEAQSDEAWTVEMNPFLVKTNDYDLQIVHFSVREWLTTSKILSDTKILTITSALQNKLSANIPVKSEQSGECPECNDTEATDEVTFQELQEQFSEAASVTSYSSSVFSKESESSSQTDMSSAFSQLETVVDQFARLFINHHSAKLVIQEFLKSKGQDGFEEVFSTLLHDYARGLRDIARFGAEKVAALMAEEKAEAIAHQVVLLSDYLDPSKVVLPVPSEEEYESKKLILDGFIRQRDNFIAPNSPKTTQEKAVDHGIAGTPWSYPNEGSRPLESSSKDTFLTLEPMEEAEVYVNLERIKGWLTGSLPFRTLVDQLSAKMREPPVKLPPLPEGSVNLQNRDDRAWYKRWKTNVFRYILNAIPGGERPLAVGMKRVRWTCFCQRQLYDDFYEIRPGAAREIQKALDRVYGHHENVKSPNAAAENSRGQLRIFIFFNIVGVLMSVLSLKTFKASPAQLVALLFGFIVLSLSLSVVLIFILILSSSLTKLGNERPRPATPGNDKIYPRNSRHTIKRGKMVSSGKADDSGNSGDSSPALSDITESSQSDCEQTVAVTRPGMELKRNQLWVLALFSNRLGEEIYVHINAVKRATDFSLFNGFREKYYLVSSAWQRFTQLRQVSSIRFVKFIISDTKRGDVVKKDVWPPEHVPQVWLYEPYPAVDTVPLVGPTYLMNLWRDTHHADSAAWEEYRRTASNKKIFLDWLQSAPHLFLQWLRQKVANWGDLDNLDDDGLDPSDVTHADTLPQHLHPTDIEQPAKQLRAVRIFRSVPKKIGDKLKVDFREHRYPEAWGLEFEEAFHVHRLLFFILLLYAARSVALLSWLLYRYGLGVPSSLSSVLWIIGWALSLYSLAVTVWFKWAENL